MTVFFFPALSSLLLQLCLDCHHQEGYTIITYCNHHQDFRSIWDHVLIVPIENYSVSEFLHPTVPMWNSVPLYSSEVAEMSKKKLCFLQIPKLGIYSSSSSIISWHVQVNHCFFYMSRRYINILILRSMWCYIHCFSCSLLLWRMVLVLEGC